MISVLDIILIILMALLLFGLSIISIIIPFTGLDGNLLYNINYFLNSIKGNYILIIIGIITLLVSIKLFSILFKKEKNKNNKFIVKWTEYGEIMISSETIVGLVNAITSKFTGFNDSRVDINIEEGKLLIDLKGNVNPEINIPEIMEELQKRIKEHVEKSSGVEVSEVKIYINNVTQPNRNLK